MTSCRNITQKEGQDRGNHPQMISWSSKTVIFWIENHLVVSFNGLKLGSGRRKEQIFLKNNTANSSDII